jgi:SAM-dependent methyltransferase
LAERQTATTLDGIAVDHLARYRFAAEQVKGRILDAACGVGYGSQVIGASVAVDVCQAALDFAEKFYPGPEYVQGRLEEKPWEGSFDWIVSFETLEHLRDPGIVLAHFAESLNEGGRFVCSVPNEEWYPFNPEKFKEDEYPHQRHYTPDEFAELLAPWFSVDEKHSQISKHDPKIRQGTRGGFLIYVCQLLPKR